ncbi:MULTISPECIES: xylan 1,4-beta-xylosidase [Streptomyces]|uniref:xylan 1,4-beta-xylosidase n=1 Tax=Streptomyces TaxID=1883 RepID=UPI003C30B0A4
MRRQRRTGGPAPAGAAAGAGASDPRRRRPGTALLLAIGVTALSLLLVMCGFPPDGAPDGRNGDPGPHGTPRMSGGKPAPELGWGFTHTQYSADDGRAAARSRADRMLSARPIPQNQHIMGWGADNPEPAPGRYDFSALDSRIDLIRRTGGTPVITLCCAPDWMKGGERGKTDWSREWLEKAPDPAYYDDFARLSGVVARRYPDVRHFIVWNELKGFYDDDRQRWDAEAYTRLYNLVHAELKKANKENLVGGPYVVMDSQPPGESTNASEVKGPWGSLDRRALDAVRYWNENKAGADFVVVDGSSYTREDALVPDEFRATAKFTAVSRWVREETGLPLWWAEWYVEPGDENDERDGWSEPHRRAVHAAALIAMSKGGATTGFYWNPQKRSTSCAGCLWRGTAAGDGGSALPMMDLLSRFSREFPPGSRFTEVEVAAGDRPYVRVLADEDAVLVVNIRNRPIAAEVDGRSFDLGAYGVRWLKR